MKQHTGIILIILIFITNIMTIAFLIWERGSTQIWERGSTQNEILKAIDSNKVAIQNVYDGLVEEMNNIEIIIEYEN